MEQFLESLFIIQPDTFVTIDRNIFVSNIHVLPGLIPLMHNSSQIALNTYSNVDDRLDPSSKSELQELLLAEGKAKKRKFGPTKHESDSSASKLSRGLNDNILKQSRSGDSWEKEPAANILRQCDSGSRDSQVVV